MNTRRQFLIRAPLSLLVTTAALKSGSSQTPSQTPTTPGAPPTFGTGSGPVVTPETFAEAEKLMQVTMTAAEREQAAESSAGPGAATAAALVAFSIGSETGGSIVSPAMRCGVTGLRPTLDEWPAPAQ